MRLSRAKAERALRAGSACLLAAGLLTTAAGHTQTIGCAAGQSLGNGLCLATTGTLDLLGVLAGGVRRGEAAVGQLRVALDVDLAAAAGMEGWRAHVSVLGIAGRSLTATRLGSLSTASNIEAAPSIRLNELWLERTVENLGSLRFGQLAADAEFAVADSAGKLVNSNFGWPLAMAANLPAGGPAYPLPTLGARVALGDPEGGTGLRLGVFSGDPSGGGGDAGADPQRRNRHGVTFSTTGGAFLIGEVVTGAPAPVVEGDVRAWSARLGGWLHTAEFSDFRSGPRGPRRYDENYGGYAVAEVTVLRDRAESLTLFARAFAAPGDRNVVSLQVDGGLAWRAPLGQEGDTLSFGVTQARIGSAARQVDRDLVRRGVLAERRDRETVIELNYDRMVVENRLWVRPLVQYVVNPGASAPDDRVNPRRGLDDAWVVGLRLTATY